MKSLLKHLFTLALLTQLGAGVPSLAAAEPSHVWLKETFEDGEPGTTPADWSVSLPELMTATIVTNPDGGKALSLDKPEVSDDSPLLSGPLLKDVPESGIVCVKASVMAMHQKAVGSLVVQAPGGMNNVSMNVGRSPALISEKDGFIRLPVQFKEGQWVDLLFRLNLDAKTYDAFVNGALVASDVGYGSTSPRPGRNALQIQFLFVNSSQGTFLLDNLEILEGDVAPPVTPPGDALKDKQQ
jgi:hypothetical protein